jgi:hypothetical protein
MRAGYKKYNDYNKIYCLDSQKYILTVQAIVRGYVNGFCSTALPNGLGGSDADQASFDCAKGPDSASWLIK